MRMPAKQKGNGGQMAQGANKRRKKASIKKARAKRKTPRKFNGRSSVA